MYTILKQLTKTLTQTSSKSVFLDVFNLLLEGALIFGDVIGINFLNQTFARLVL